MAGQKRVLYDLTVHLPEWQQYIVQETVRTFPYSATNAASGALWETASRIRHPLGGVRANIPSSVAREAEISAPWSIALSDDGSALAVLTDRGATIRVAKDDFGSVHAEWTATGEAFRESLRHRCVAWDPEGSILVIAANQTARASEPPTACTLFVISVEGMLLHSCTAEAVGVVGGVAGLGVRAGHCSGDVGDCYEVVVASYSGVVSKLHVPKRAGPRGDVTTGNPLSRIHDCRHGPLTPETPPLCSVSGTHLGVGCMAWQPQSGVLAVGGTGVDARTTEGYVASISFWTQNAKDDGFDLAHASAPDIPGARSCARLKWLTRSGTVPYIHKMLFSPGGGQCVALDTGHNLTVWRGSGATWFLQHTYRRDNPALQKFAGANANTTEGDVTDVGWWNEEALVLALRGGQVVVCSVDGLENMLGDFPEKFDRLPAITSTKSGRFFVLECEKTPVRVPARWGEAMVPMLGLTDVDRASDARRDEAPVDEGSRLRWLQELPGGVAAVVRAGLMYATDNEDWGRPEWLTVSVPRQIHRIVSLRQATPEELFARKVRMEEYGDALELARAYGLNTDPVYQAQWAACPVTKHSLRDYLSKVNDLKWVLRECATRVPDTLNGMTLLLEYGLKRTNIERLAPKPVAKAEVVESGAKGKEEAHSSGDDTPAPPSSSTAEQDVNAPLTAEELVLCALRVTLLQYLDRLRTWAMLSTYQTDFNVDGFRKFRDVSLAEAAIKMARKNAFGDVELIMTYHLAEVVPHQLSILSAIPETTDPNQYEQLLIAIESNTHVQVTIEEKRHRATDWVESPAIMMQIRARMAPLPYPPFALQVAAEPPGPAESHAYPLSLETTRGWYEGRAREIESLSGRVDHALSLIKIAMDNGVTGLDDFHGHVASLAVAVYQCGADLTLNAFEALSDSQRIALLLQGSTENDIVTNINIRVKPFFRGAALRGRPHSAAQAGTQLLEEYLSTTAATRLPVCAAVLAPKKLAAESQRVFSDVVRMLHCALACIYNCQTSDAPTLTAMEQILHSLPTAGMRPADADVDEYNGLMDRVATLSKHVTALRILSEYGLPQPIQAVANATHDQAVAIMTRLAVKTPSSNAAFNTDPRRAWAKLLGDLTQLQTSVFPFVDIAWVRQKFLEGLLFHRKYNLVEQLMATSMSWLDIEKAVVVAAQEAFNACASVQDEGLEEAAACLHVVPGRHASSAVRAELDLIEGVRSVHKYGLDLLPLQIRLTSDRATIVDDILHRDPRVYRNAGAIVELGRQLGLSSPSDAARVRSLIGQAAFRDGAYDIATKLYWGINELGFGAEGWKLAKDLASATNFDNVDEQIDLAREVVMYCPPENISEALALVAMLETESEIARLRGEQELNTSAEAEPPSDDFHQLLDAVASIPARPDNTEARAELQLAVLAANRQAVADAVFEGIVREIDAADEQVAWKAELKLSMLLAIKDLARVQSYFDSLSSTPTQASAAMRLATAFYCIRACTEAAVSLPARITGSDSVAPRSSPLYTMPLAELVRLTEKTVPREDEEHPVYALAWRHVIALRDRLQAQTMAFHLGDVDEARLAADSAYSKQLILRLARSLDHGSVSVATDLGPRYGVSPWLVAFTYVEFLLTQTREDGEPGVACTLDEVERRVAAVQDLLRTEPEELATRLAALRDQLPDVGLSRLVLYYRLLAEAERARTGAAAPVEPVGDAEVTGTLPERHLDCLSKLLKQAPEINYKLLTSGSEESAQRALIEVLTDSNVGPLAKIATRIPDVPANALSASVVYRLYLVRMMGDTRGGTSDADAQERYLRCKSLFSKLLPEDQGRFAIDAAALAAAVPVTLRMNIVTETMDSLAGAAGKSGAPATTPPVQPAAAKGKKAKAKAEVAPEPSTSAAAESTPSALAPIIERLKQIAEHLKFVQKLSKVSGFAKTAFLTDYDASLGDTEKVRETLVRMVRSHTPYALLVRFMDKIQWRDTAENVTTRCISSLFGELPDSRAELEGLVEALSKDESASSETRGELLRGTEAALLSFVTDANVPLKERAAAQRLFLAHGLGGGDAGTLRLEVLESQALIDATWNMAVDASRLSSVAARLDLQRELSAKAADGEQQAQLAALLGVWTAGAADKSVYSDAWRAVLEQLAGSGKLELVVRLAMGAAYGATTEEADAAVVCALLTLGVHAHAGTVALLSAHAPVREAGVTVFAASTSVEVTVLGARTTMPASPLRIDALTATLLVRSGSVARVVAGPAFGQIFERLVRGLEEGSAVWTELPARPQWTGREQAESLVYSVALLASSHALAQAGALVLAYCGLPRSAWSVNNSINALKRYLKDEIAQLRTKAAGQRKEEAGPVVKSWTGVLALVESALIACSL